MDQNVQSTASRITPDTANRLFPGVHLKALRCVSDDPTYVSAGRQEYKIEQDGVFWQVKRWPRGVLPRSLRTQFTSFKQCEDALIRFLKSKDKWGKALYPGKE